MRDRRRAHSQELRARRPRPGRSGFFGVRACVPFWRRQLSRGVCVWRKVPEKRNLCPMKAMLCKEYGPPESLVLTELASEPCGAQQLKIGVHACGVNFP